jgi:predicted HD phosphohydrolase
MLGRRGEGDGVAYSRMDQGTAEDYLYEQTLAPLLLEPVADVALGQLELLKGECLGAQIDRYQHSLQTATRARRDGADAETVVCALLHDIGDALAPANHAELAAALLRPYVSEQSYWVVKHHDIFQGYYFFHHLGGDRDMRDRYRDHPHYAATVRFCAAWDMRSFDPAYETDDLDSFLPLVREVFGRQPRDVLTHR